MPNNNDVLNDNQAMIRMFDAAKDSIDVLLWNRFINIPVNPDQIGNINSIAFLETALTMIREIISNLERAMGYFSGNVTSETRYYCKGILDSIIARLENVKNAIRAKRTQIANNEDPESRRFHKCLKRIARINENIKRKGRVYGE